MKKKVYLSQADDIWGSKISNAPENDSFADPFFTFGIREGKITGR